MQKRFCDICAKEINNNWSHYETHPYSEGVESIFDKKDIKVSFGISKGERGQGPFTPILMDLCKRCAMEIMGDTLKRIEEE